jgi:hypothetical protein
MSEMQLIDDFDKSTENSNPAEFIAEEISMIALDIAGCVLAIFKRPATDSPSCFESTMNEGRASPIDTDLSINSLDLNEFVKITNEVSHNCNDPSRKPLTGNPKVGP